MGGAVREAKVTLGPAPLNSLLPAGKLRLREREQVAQSHRAGLKARLPSMASHLSSSVKWGADRTRLKGRREGQLGGRGQKLSAGPVPWGPQCGRCGCVPSPPVALVPSATPGNQNWRPASFRGGWGRGFFPQCPESAALWWQQTHEIPQTLR